MTNPRLQHLGRTESAKDSSPNETSANFNRIFEMSASQTLVAAVAVREGFYHLEKGYQEQLREFARFSCFSALL